MNLSPSSPSLQWEFLRLAFMWPVAVSSPTFSSHPQPCPALVVSHPAHSAMFCPPHFYNIHPLAHHRPRHTLVTRSAPERPVQPLEALLGSLAGNSRGWGPRIWSGREEGMIQVETQTSDSTGRVAVGPREVWGYSLGLRTEFQVICA